ncbi:MAG TPA: 30S ribosomal protein S6 [Candidatus Nanoarchaeia archaeon]
MEHEYELVVVTSADLTEVDREKILEQIKKAIESEKGKVTDTQDWGKRELAYKIKKNSHGFYSQVTFEANSKTPQVLNSKFRLMDELLRFLILRKEGEKVGKVVSNK